MAGAHSVAEYLVGLDHAEVDSLGSEPPPMVDSESDAPNEYESKDYEPDVIVIDSEEVVRQNIRSASARFNHFYADDLRWDVPESFEQYNINLDSDLAEISRLLEFFPNFAAYVDDDYTFHLRSPNEQPLAPVRGSLVVPVEESKNGSLIIEISESKTRQ